MSYSCPYIEKAWKDYDLLFQKFIGYSNLAFDEWPSLVKEAYMNWKYQHQLNELCEVDLSVVGSKYQNV